MDLQKIIDGGLAALAALKNKPPRRTPAQNRAIVSACLTELQDALNDGKGFHWIASAFRDESGIRISASTLKLHYLALTGATTTAQNDNPVMLIAQGTSLPQPVTGLQAADLVKGRSYTMVHIKEKGKEKAIVYHGIENGQYVFDVMHKDGTAEPRRLSEIAIKYYAFKEAA